jgi:hypothetical protein
LRNYDWDNLRKSRGPADWEWRQGIGALILAIGLIGYGIVIGPSL